MYDPLKYDESLKASIDRLEKFKQSLADGDIRRNIIDKELYEGYILRVGGNRYGYWEILK